MPVAAAIRQTVLLQPPTRVLPMTLSAGVITPQTRALVPGIDGAGAQGLGVWPAITNIINDPLGVIAAQAGSGVGNQLTTANMAYAAATAQTVAPYPSVSTAIKGTATGAVTTQWQWVAAIGAPIADTTEAIRISLKGEGQTIGKTATVVALCQGGAHGNANVTVGTVVLSSVFTEVAASVAVDFNDRTAISIRVNITGPADQDVTYATCIQCNNNVALSMPLTVGSFSGDAWSGTANASSSTRVAGRVQLPVRGLFTATQGAIAACVVPSYASTATPANPRTFDWETDTGNGLFGLVVTGTAILNMTSNATGGAGTATSATVFSANVAGLLVDAWTRTQLLASNRNAAFGTSVRTAVDVIAAALTDLVNVASLNRALNGLLRWLLTFKGVLLQSDVTLMNSWGATVPMLAQIAQLSPGSKPTCLVPCVSADALLLPAYFDGT